MSALIHVDSVWKNFGETPVLERVNLDVNRGEFITIVGASGCGKTTFLRMLLGVEQPSRGRITLNGRTLPDEPNEERGVVFQKYSVFPHLTVLENVVLALELPRYKWLARSFGATRRSLRDRAATILEQVGLQHTLQSYPHALSGGMQQRLALAQALITKPTVLLLDEPFGALDPGIRKDMQALVQQLHRDAELTIFMITHDISEAFLLGSRVLVFDKVRNDPDEPERFGSTITFDLPATARSDALANDLEAAIRVEPAPAVVT